MELGSGKLITTDIGSHLVLSTVIDNKIQHIQAIDKLTATVSMLVAVTAGAAGPTNKDDCEVCEPRKFQNRLTCQELQTLQNRTQNLAGVKRLCEKIIDEAALVAVATKLNSYAVAEAKLFLDDILCGNNIANAANNTQSICNFVNSLDANKLAAWKVCKEARPNSAGIRLDWELVQSVSEYLTNSNLKAKLTIDGLDRLVRLLKSDANYVGSCHTCAPSTSTACERLPYLQVYLNTLKNFTTRYALNQTIPGFARFITGEATSSGDLKQDGAYFLMKDLSATTYSSSVQSFEGTISSKLPGFPSAYQCADCSYDVEEAGNVLVDYKSVGCSWSLAGKKEQQFRQYLQYWSNATGQERSFRYIFNAEKMTLQQAKQKFVALFNTNPSLYYNINPTFFNRILLSDGITPLSNSTQFEIELRKSNFWQNAIFDFVTVAP